MEYPQSSSEWISRPVYNRREMAKESIFRDLLEILMSTSSEIEQADKDSCELVDRDTCLLLIAECFRCLRNACVQCAKNQHVMRNLGLISTSVHLIKLLHGIQIKEELLLTGWKGIECLIAALRGTICCASSLNELIVLSERNWVQLHRISVRAILHCLWVPERGALSIAPAFLCSRLLVILELAFNQVVQVLLCCAGATPPKFLGVLPWLVKPHKNALMGEC